MAFQLQILLRRVQYIPTHFINHELINYDDYHIIKNLYNNDKMIDIMHKQPKQCL